MFSLGNWCQNQIGHPKAHQSHKRPRVKFHFSLGLTVVFSDPHQMCGASLEANLQLPMSPGRGDGSCRPPEGGTSQKSTGCSVRGYSQKHQIFVEISKPPPGMEVSHLSLLTLVTCVHWTLQESMGYPQEPSPPILTDGCSLGWSGDGIAEVTQQESIGCLPTL